MTDSQRHALRASEIRERLNVIQGLEGDDLTEEIRSESDGLQTEYRDVEARKRAAIVAEDGAPASEPGPVIDAEMRERLELRSKASLTAFVVAAMRGRQVDGAEAELSEACEARGDIPVEMFTPDPRENRTENRTVTEAPGTVGVNVAPIQPHVFAPSPSRPTWASTCRKFQSRDLLASSGSTRH